MEFSLVFSPAGLNNTVLPQGCVLENAPTVGTVGKGNILKTGTGVRDAYCPVWSSPRINWQSSPPPMTLSDRRVPGFDQYNVTHVPLWKFQPWATKDLPPSRS